MGNIKQVPVLDCSVISGPLSEIKDTKEFAEFSQNLGHIMSTVGFAYLVNHGIHSSLVEDLLQKSIQFFESPQEVKNKFRKADAVNNYHGYSQNGDESAGEGEKKVIPCDLKEGWDCWGLESLDEANYPSEIPGFQAAFENLRLAKVELVKKLLRGFAVYLKLDDLDFFIKRHLAIDDQRIRSQNVIRSTYYNPLGDIEVNEDSLRLQEHSDWGTITLLIQDMMGGLEAELVNGDWIPVTPIKDSIILNSGLMLEMWSGGHLPATPHRVKLIPEKKGTVRQSIAYFIQPDGDTVCEPIVEEKRGWTPTYPKADKQTHFEYFQDRVRATRVY